MPLTRRIGAIYESFILSRHYEWLASQDIGFLLDMQVASLCVRHIQAFEDYRSSDPAVPILFRQEIHDTS
jgi:hypothetical protein